MMDVRFLKNLPDGALRPNWHWSKLALQTPGRERICFTLVMGPFSKTCELTANGNNKQIQKLSPNHCKD